MLNLIMMKAADSCIIRYKKSFIEHATCARDCRGGVSRSRVAGMQANAGTPKSPAGDSRRAHIKNLIL